MDSIMECSKRTVTKIIVRLKIGCFNCGWDQARCDMHHIIPQASGGTDDQNNLTYLCPNCHRLAHTGRLKIFKSFQELIGDSWKKHYNVTPLTKSTRPWSGKRCYSKNEALQEARDKRSADAISRAILVIDLFEKSNLDITKYGWKQKASEILGVTPQKVSWYLKKYAPHLLEGANNRSSVRLKKK